MKLKTSIKLREKSGARAGHVCKLVRLKLAVNLNIISALEACRNLNFMLHMRQSHMMSFTIFYGLSERHYGWHLS